MIEFQSTKLIIYVHIFDDVCAALSQFRQDIENAIKATEVVKIAFDTEWPVYFEGDFQNRKKTNGKINIIQLGSNVIDYTVILEMYNFTSNDQQIRAISQKLRAIFSLKISAFTGCNQKSDFTLMNKQYLKFKLPEESKKLMDNVSIMALNWGVVRRGRNKATLQALCRQQNMFLKKPSKCQSGHLFRIQKRKSLKRSPKILST